jgi:hypothetical protein
MKIACRNLISPEKSGEIKEYPKQGKKQRESQSCVSKAKPSKLIMA